MPNEAVEKIELLFTQFYFGGKSLMDAEDRCKLISQILKLSEQPSSPPPILRKHKINKLCNDSPTLDEYQLCHLIAQAQRDADVEYYKGYL